MEQMELNHIHIILMLIVSFVLFLSVVSYSYCICEMGSNDMNKLSVRWFILPMSTLQRRSGDFIIETF